jgi:hypothetical protein
MPARVYRVTDAESNAVHFVIANSPAQAVGHVVRSRFAAKPASALELARHGKPPADATAKAQQELGGQ